MECVERGELEGPKVTALLQQLLGPWLSQPVKAVVLGCTHYPFLRKTIAALFPAGTPLIDGNAGSVRQLRRRLEEQNLLSDRQKPGRITFLSSSEDPSVLQRMQTMLELCANESESAVRAKKRYVHEESHADLRHPARSHQNVSAGAGDAQAPRAGNRRLRHGSAPANAGSDFGNASMWSRSTT